VLQVGAFVYALARTMDDDLLGARPRAV